MLCLGSCSCFCSWFFFFFFKQKTAYEMRISDWSSDVCSSDLHGVNATTANTTADDIAIGDVLLSAVADRGADMLVMGAWGHSRLRELVFGGATRHVLRTMTVPVLMSH